MILMSIAEWDINSNDESKVRWEKVIDRQTALQQIKRSKEFYSNWVLFNNKGQQVASDINFSLLPLFDVVCNNLFYGEKKDAKREIKRVNCC